MPTYGNHIEINTYTGGCGTRVIDVNPQINVGVTSQLVVSCALVDSLDRPLRESGVIYDGFPEANVPAIQGIRWLVEDAPPGGVKVHVYAQYLGEVTVDTATCRT